MSRTADDESSQTEPGWLEARNQLFRMIMEGRSFSGRERNCCFLNTGTGRFATISALSGIDFPDDGRCIAVTDWDRDGDVDMWTSNRNAPRLRLMRNNTASRNHYLSLKLEGTGESTNRDAIGARVEVVLRAHSSASTGDNSIRRLCQTLRAGEGFLSQSSKWVHFGLGAAEVIDYVVVHWPGGEPQRFIGLAADRRYYLTQGQSAAEAVESPGPSTALADGELELPAETRKARVVLVTRVPMPSVSFTSSDGAVMTEPFDAGQPTLVNLWASWCPPCLAELAEITSKRQQLADAGVKVLALSVDQLAEEPARRENAGHALRQMDFNHSWGHIDLFQMTALQQLNDQFFFLKQALPLPTSFLVDAQGRLAVIYRGPVDVEQLLADAQLAAGGYEQSAIQAACLPGRVIIHPRVEAVARRADLQTRYRVAAWLEESGRYRDAFQNFAELVQIDPSWALPHRHLAKLCLNDNRLTDAHRHATLAVQLDPSSATAHNTLGLVYSQQGNQQSAEAQLQLAVQLDPNLAEAQNNLGSVLASQGKFEAARACFQRAVQIDIRFVEAHTNLGSAYAALNDNTRAVEQFMQALRIDPNYVDAHNNLGTMYARQGDFQQAIRHYEVALRLQPNNPDTRRNLDLARKLLK